MRAYVYVCVLGSVLSLGGCATRGLTKPRCDVARATPINAPRSDDAPRAPADAMKRDHESSLHPAPEAESEP
jgi:hypothetical protein